MEQRTHEPRPAIRFTPTRPLGWVAVASAIVGLGSWILLPIVTTVFRSRYPVTDTFAMPVIGLVLVAIAAAVNVLALWPGRQRSVLNVAGTVLTVAATLFFGSFVVGEGFSGG